MYTPISSQSGTSQLVGQVAPSGLGLQTTVTLGPAMLSAGGVDMLLLQIDTLYRTATGVAVVMRPEAGMLLRFTPKAGKRYRIAGDLKVPQITWSFTTAAGTIQGVWNINTNQYLVTPVLGPKTGTLTLYWKGHALLQTITLGPL